MKRGNNLLGNLYYPTGKAKETAQQILEVDNPMACNVAWGCTNACQYCFIRYVKKGEMRMPKVPPFELVDLQIRDGLKPEGVFLSFSTDPFLPELEKTTNKIIELLENFRVATLSKRGFTHIDYLWKIRNGMTIVSDSDEFSKKFEPNALPVTERIKYLREIAEQGGYTWVSLEPFPTPNLFKQDLTKLLDEIDFVDFIVFGKWNYSTLTNDKTFYKESVDKFIKYCSEKGIRHFVKSDTLKFIK